MQTAVQTNWKITFEEAINFFGYTGRFKHIKGRKAFRVLCPIHPDQNPSMDVIEKADGTAQFTCYNPDCCGDEKTSKEFMKKMRKLFRGEKITQLPRTKKQIKDIKLLPLTLQELADEKGIPFEDLRKFGLYQGVWSDPTKEGVTQCVMIPSFTMDGEIYSKKQARMLQELINEDGEKKIKKAIKRKGNGDLIPYGLNRLKEAKETGHLFLVEGESDCWTLWVHDFHALGIPGSGNTKFLKAEYLEGIQSLYILNEKDQAAKKFIRSINDKLKELEWDGEIHIVTMPDGCKDPNELHLQLKNQEQFMTKMIELIGASPTFEAWNEMEKAKEETAATTEKSNVIPFPSHTSSDWWEENPNGTKSLKHHILAEYVIEKRTIVRYPDAHGDLYYYNDQSGLYELDKSCRKIRAFIRREDNLKRNQVREVQEYIEDMCPIKYEISKDYIAVGNGLLRLSDMEFKPFTPDEFITTKIPTNYNPKAYDEFVADTLYKVSCGHSPTMENITEMFGAVLYPKLLVPKMFYLYGRSAHNGKSSTLFMIHKTFNDGCNNISAISPQKLANNTFAGSSIYGKIANIVDDLPDEPITDSGTFKSIITGGYIDIEFKNRPSQTVQMSTVCITASNHYPNFRETGTQINKRLHIIPFDHNFLQDEDALPEMESMKRLETQQAREYVLLLAVQAVKQMLNRSGNVLTPNEKAESAKNDFAEANDPLTDFFCEYDKKFFDEVKGTEALEAYYEWCKENYNNYPLSPKRFKEKVCSHYNMEWKTKKMKINGVWKAVKGFKSKDGSNEESEPIKKEQEEKQEIKLNPDFLDL